MQARGPEEQLNYVNARVRSLPKDGARPSTFIGLFRLCRVRSMRAGEAPHHALLRPALASHSHPGCAVLA
jgi:hypothetical protein